MCRTSDGISVSNGQQYSEYKQPIQKMRTIAKQQPVSSNFQFSVFPSLIRKSHESDSLEATLQRTVFGSLPIRDIKLLSRSTKKGVGKFNDKLVLVGEENDRLYLLVKGSCLIKNGGKFFAEIDAGHFVGEMSYFNHQPVSADVVARGPLEYVYWERKDLDRLFTRRPGLRSRFYKVLIQHMANRLLHTTRKIVA